MIKVRNPLLVDLLIGNMIYGLLGEVFILVFTKDKLYISIGFLIGIALSCFHVIHMANNINEALYMGEVGARRRSVSGYYKRMFTIVFCVIALFYLGIGDVLAALAGVMALKVSAYIQPFTYKYITKKRISKRG